MPEPRLHNVDVAAVERTAAAARRDPAAARQPVAFDGEWQTGPEADGGPQFRATIPFPGGETVFECDFPPPMGGSGAAPNPLAYCFWGGLACYAMTYAQEAARHGVELRRLRARVETEVDQRRALGVSDDPPVQRLDWTLEVDADADAATLEQLKQAADEHCPGVWCLRNPVALTTRVDRS